MFRYSYALLCALFLLSSLETIIARKSFGGGGRHSYPKSGSLSGGGYHHSSGGLSGGSGHGYPSSGGNHGYPSGGLSGGSHAYPSSGGNHGYPSGGLSGNSGSSGGSHAYPSSGGTHGYPSPGSKYPTGSSNNHGYPAGSGLSGNSPSRPSTTTHVTHHYNYNPPQQIRYTPVRGGAPVSYPVYHGPPPTYVYKYKDSGSKYGTLLAGLALLNLGALGTAAYVGSQRSHSNYQTQPGEVCKFGVKKDNGDYEETKINCQIITSFIFSEQAKTPNNTNKATVTTTTTVTNVTVVNATNGAPLPAAPSAPASDVLYKMYENGTLVPVNATSFNITANATSAAPAAADATNNTMTSSVTTTVVNTTTTVTDALDVKGKPVDVTPGMECFVIRVTPTSRMKKSLSCGVLQTFADNSIQKKNSAYRNLPTFTILTAIISTVLIL